MDGLTDYKPVQLDFTGDSGIKILTDYKPVQLDFTGDSGIKILTDYKPVQLDFTDCPVPGVSSGGGGVDSGQQGSTWQTVKEEMVTDSLYLCPACNQLFSQPKCLTVHLKKLHQMDCNEVETYGISMEGSVLRLKRVWKNQPRHRYNYKCLLCGSFFSCRKKLSHHIRVMIEQKKLSCQSQGEEGAVGLNQYQREIFLTGGRRKILCHTCGAAFTEKSTFLNHIDTHGEVLGKAFACTLCPYSASAERFLRHHYERKHPPAPRTRSHVCDQCGKAFYEKIVLEEHVTYVHVKQRTFQCDKCPKVFHRPQSFLKHKKTHLGKRPHVCGQCGSSFAVPYNLKVHMRLHTGEKPFQCQHCDMAFRQKNALDLHLKKHANRLAVDRGAKGLLNKGVISPRVQTQGTLAESSKVLTMPGYGLSTPGLQAPGMLANSSPVLSVSSKGLCVPGVQALGMITDSSLEPSATSKGLTVPSVQAPVMFADSSKDLAVSNEGLCMPAQGLCMPAQGLCMPTQGLCIPAQGLTVPGTQTSADMPADGVTEQAAVREAAGGRGGVEVIFADDSSVTSTAALPPTSVSWPYCPDL